jgi:lysophospholipase L1-like esterase
MAQHEFLTDEEIEALPKRQRPRSRIFLNGDSVTYGYWDEYGGWANRFKVKAMREFMWKYEVVNLALGNQTLDTIVDRLPSQISPYGRARNLGVFMIGGADAAIQKGATEPKHPLPEFKQSLRALGDLVCRHRITPMFVGPYEIDDSLTNPDEFTGTRRTNALYAEYADAVREFAADIDAPYVELNQMNSRPVAEVVSWDHLHPSEEGHRLIAEDVYDAVKVRLEDPLLSYMPPRL